ncbi:hypothetical protein GGF32_006922, partial [Allomyces javanicus]
TLMVMDDVARNKLGSDESWSGSENGTDGGDNLDEDDRVCPSVFPLEADDLIPLAQLPHLAHLECDVIVSRKLLIPTMPALRVLQFDEGWDYLHGERKTLWTVPSTAAWATAMPHLETLNYMARFLKRVCARDIRRRCEASKELTIINAEYARAIRVEYTQDNVCSWQLLFKGALIPPDSRRGNVPRTVKEDVAPGVNGMDFDWLELLIEWSARLFVFGITQEVVLRAVGGANLVEKAHRDAHWTLWRTGVSLTAVDPSNET